jgi:DeoR family transcriptional regulator, glycerol-3-phosphate regulon repressor
VLIAGGNVRRDGGIVGQASVDFINQFKFDFALVGISGIDSDGSLLDFDYQEVRVSQAIIANARQDHPGGGLQQIWSQCHGSPGADHPD